MEGEDWHWEERKGIKEKGNWNKGNKRIEI